MRTFEHYCPYCGSHLSLKELDVERTASRCPSCNNVLILSDYGETMAKAIVYKCLNCGEELIYSGHQPIISCHKCNSLFLASEQGNCLISPDLYSKGEKGKIPYEKKVDKVVALKNKWRLMPTKKKHGLYAGLAAAICLLVGLYIYSLPPSIEKSKAYADMDNVWKEFRDKNPYSIQIEGLKKYDDNSYVAIVSEPNERVTEKELKKFFKSYNCHFKTFKKKIGYDGWLRDAVVSFNDLDPDDISKFAKRLSMLLYGTDYKAEIMDFSIIPEHTAFSSYDLNQQVTEEELRKWFIEDNESLVSIEDTTDVKTLTEVLGGTGDNMQVLMSKQPGFVVWVMDIGYCDTEEFRLSARKFSLDSDLIFGAIASSNKVAVIARERCVPIYELPPMREETLRLLAGTDEEELAQSYERTSLLAGKLPGGKDYAPIYLSNELWHTEYGNILNVTDQMLKSWSENGMIDYVDFHYPKPVDWIFDLGVSSDLGVNTLTYNWNTAGVGYIVEDESYNIYALNRTGSLPVSYIPGESEGISDSDPVYQAEQNAYDFFSNLSSPELVKVVQYAAMYQIFRNIGVHVRAKYESEYMDSVMCVSDDLKLVANKCLYSLKNITKEDKEKVAEYFKVSLMKKDAVRANPNLGGISIDDTYMIAGKVNSLDDIGRILNCTELIMTIDSIHHALQSVSSDDAFMSSLEDYLTDRNASLSYTSESYGYSLPDLSAIGSQTRTESHTDRIDRVLNLFNEYSFEIQHYNRIIGNIDVSQCMNYYLEANKNKCLTWMKCPTIVQSWSLKDSTNSIGGHNLNSKVTSFRVAKDLKPGQTRTVEVNGKKIIEISAKDRLTHVSDPNYLRRVGRLGNSEIRGAEVPLRARNEVAAATQRRSARGYNSNDHLSIKLDAQLGHTINGKKYNSLEDLLNEAGRSLEKGKTEFKQIEFDGLKDAGVDVDVIVDNIKCRMRKGSNSSIPMSSYDFANYTVKYEGEKAIVTIPIKSGNIEFGSTSKVIQAGYGGSSTVRPMLKILEGRVVFKMPKTCLDSFIKLIQEFMAKQRGHWNEFKLKMEMKRRGINPADCEETTRLKVAKNRKLFNKYHNNVWILQEKTVA